MVRNVFPALNVYAALDTTDPLKAEIFLSQHDVDVVFSGNPEIINVFASHGLETHYLNRFNNISGHKIRQLLNMNDIAWKWWIHPKNVKLIKNWLTMHSLQ